MESIYFWSGFGIVAALVALAGVAFGIMLFCLLQYLLGGNGNATLRK
jgi:hypothetical protein